MTSSDISSFKFPMSDFIRLGWIINRPVMIVILLVFLVVYCSASGILLYHWSKYGMGNRGVAVARVLFLFVSVVLFCVAGLSISYY